MYFEHYFPFYATYANPMLYEGERMQEQEFELMKSYYPITVQQIQERVEEECDHLVMKAAGFMTNIRINICFTICAARLKRA